MRYARYTTYNPDQLNATIGKIGTASGPVATGQSDAAAPGRTRILRTHRCSVSYQDGSEGNCEYVRGGPRWHVFRYRHVNAAGDSHPLPVQNLADRMGNAPADIESKSRVLAYEAFEAAIQAELRDYFRRAIPPSGKIVDPTACQMSAERAKEIGGRYALCLRLGQRMLPAGDHFETIEAANEAWRERKDRKFLVGCACRWSRRWEIPRFNPLNRDEAYGER